MCGCHCKSVLGMTRDVPDSNFDRILDSWRPDSAGYRISDTRYQIQFYANNQCGFVLSQICFKDLKQFCRYGASERY